ncbi:hypothetical protein [Aestuariispira insulae]|uniref:Uncharacterized protein n=1 Tax=Aestuariispira insulae TaxID=1461337 RepID=A0A3D9HGM6_9PROT|nr:hypothetical protein [Aestuariispira insulae]RED48623.1 hypothetical protein DFP90_107127 [Aestuariispira insulae]
MTADRSERLSKARDYPYAFPRQSFIYHDSEIRPFNQVATEGRIPVLAIGSNQSPVRLTQKYGHLRNQQIPVQRAELDDFDIFYCAHITSYGAVGAMLQHCPGARVDLAVNWLNEEQLEIMHATEGNYAFCRLENLALALDGQGTLDQAYVYVGTAGHMILQDQPVAMAAVSCRNRRHPASSTAALLSRIHKMHDLELDEDAFILQLVEDPDFRRFVSSRLARGSVPFAYPHDTV